MKIRHLSLVALAAALLLPLATPDAHAQTYTAYNSQIAFAAVTSTTLYTIPAPSSGTSQTVDSPYSLGTLNFTDTTTPTALSLVRDGSFGSSQTYLASQTSFGAAAETLTITLSGRTALSFTVGTYDRASSVAVTVNGTALAPFTTAGGAPSSSFYGLTSTTPITSLVFSITGAPADEIDILNFRVGSVVPEPSSWAAVAAGAGLLGVVTLRRCARRA